MNCASLESAIDVSRKIYNVCKQRWNNKMDLIRDSNNYIKVSPWWIIRSELEIIWLFLLNIRKYIRLYFTNWKIAWGFLSWDFYSSNKSSKFHNLQTNISINISNLILKFHFKTWNKIEFWKINFIPSRDFL